MSGKEVETNNETVDIRDAAAGDAAAIVEIYNHYIETSPCTFDLHPFTAEQRAPWFAQFAPRGPHRLLTAAQNGQILGYACATRHRAKPAYDQTVETSVYIRHDAHGRGLGAALYASLLTAAAEGGAHLAVAGIALPNPASVALHEKLGFSVIGTFSEIGFKFDRYWDTFWMQKRLL